MPRGNTPFIAFNRGLISERSIARVDLDRTRLSAAKMNNWLPKTQGNMIIRPGTKMKGNTHNDTGATWLEFVASTDDVALLELTNDTGSVGDDVRGVMRVWAGTDAHELSLIWFPQVTTTVTYDDTGWEDYSTGGIFVSGSSSDIVPTMTAAITSRHKASASSEAITGAYDSGEAWRAFDGGNTSRWIDTGDTTTSSLPSWLNMDFDTGGDTGNFEAVTGYSLKAESASTRLDNQPSKWSILASNYDTGTYATDTGKWRTEHYQDTGIYNWAVSEVKTFSLVGADTGTIEPARHWRLNVFETDTGAANQNSKQCTVVNMEYFTTASSSHVAIQGGARTFNALSIGGVAQVRKRVIVAAADQGVEHCLKLVVDRGPVTFRAGSTTGAEDYVSEATLGTGYHYFAFTPSTNVHLTLKSTELIDRSVSYIGFEDSGYLEVESPWGASNLSNIRTDQSADVVYVDCSGISPRKIERRGVGRSWSIVKYEPNDGPIRLSATSSAKLTPSFYFGNITISSDTPFFTANHVGALIRIFHNGQNGVWYLGAKDAVTDAVEVTGIGDTGEPSATDERSVAISVTGEYTGEITIERSFDGPDIGFKRVSDNIPASGSSVDTGTFTKQMEDTEDNIKVWYRCRMSSYTSGVAIIRIDYQGGAQTGIARITGFNSSTSVDAEVLRRFSDTGSGTNEWEESYWSDVYGYPTSVALHGGRLFHAQGGSIYGSVADDFESFDDDVEGDAAPIIRTLGSGPVDNIYYLVSLLRLIVGTSGSEVAIRSSSLDEALTPTNANARTFSTQGSANLRALKMDTNALFVQRSGQRVFLIGFGLEGDSLGDYKNSELTFLVPDLLASGIRSVAIQRQPDTRIHLVLNDGTVAILTYEPQEEVLAWNTWSTDTGTSSAVEEAFVLPGTNEDAVYYQIKRTINGTTSRFVEKWAKESECMGDTGLHWLMDCAVSYTDTGRTNTITGLSHLIGQDVIGWGSLDTGSTPHIDLTPDVNGVQQLLKVDTGGAETLAYTEGVHHAVIGLPYKADYKSTKLAYGAEAGTALSQMKRTDKMAFVLYQTHNNALFFGNDTGTGLDPLPRTFEEGAAVDPDKIYEILDKHAVPFPGLWDEDSRIYIQARAPRPAVILALVPTINTNDKV